MEYLPIVTCSALEKRGEVTQVGWQMLNGCCGGGVGGRGGAGGMRGGHGGGGEGARGEGRVGGEVMMTRGSRGCN